MAPVALLACLVATHALAQTLTAPARDTVGLSAARLERLKAAVQVHVDRGDIGGVITLVMRDGKLAHVETYGKADIELYQDGSFGFGLGFEIVEHVGLAGRLGSPGTYGWGSAYYSVYQVDPQERLVAIFLTQLIPAGSLDLRDRFRALVYQAIVGPPSR